MPTAMKLVALALCVALTHVHCRIYGYQLVFQDNYQLNEELPVHTAPVITLSQWTYSHVYDNRINYETNYGEYTTIFCSGSHASNLTMTKDGEKLVTEIENETTIKWTPSLKDYGKYEYLCTDTATGSNYTAGIAVTPTFEFKSSPVMITRGKGHRLTKYTLMFASSVPVMCAGPQHAKLALTKDRQKISEEELDRHVYFNMIKWVGSGPHLFYMSKFVCTDLITGYNSSAYIRVASEEETEEISTTLSEVVGRSS